MCGTTSVEAAIRPITHTHAHGESAPKNANGFHGGAGWAGECVNPSLLHSESCRVQALSIPPHITHTATPTTTASQLIFHRISATRGHISAMSHTPMSDLSRYIQNREASPNSPWRAVSTTKMINGA